MMGFGGGVDVNVGSSIAVRVVQFDYTPSRFQGEWSSKDARIGIGVVVKFGGGS